MTENLLMQLIKLTIITAIKLAAPILLSGMIIGVIISIIQATTQIQEQTLTFVPKLLVCSIMGLLFGPWMLQTSMQFFRDIMEIMIMNF